MEASAAQRARGKDLIMANSSRTMREDLPVTAVTTARPREERLETLAQQIGGRSLVRTVPRGGRRLPVVDLAEERRRDTVHARPAGPVRTGPSSVDAFHRDAAAHQLDQWAAIARLGRLPRQRPPDRCRMMLAFTRPSHPPTAPPCYSASTKL